MRKCTPLSYLRCDLQPFSLELQTMHREGESSPNHALCGLELVIPVPSFLLLIPGASPSLSAGSAILAWSCENGEGWSSGWSQGEKQQVKQKQRTGSDWRWILPPSVSFLQQTRAAASSWFWIAVLGAFGCTDAVDSHSHPSPSHLLVTGKEARDYDYSVWGAQL